MAYLSGSYSSLDDLMTQLSTWLGTTLGTWTIDELSIVTDRLQVHHTAGANIFVQFAWTATDIAVHQSLAYTGGGAPGTHPNNSGNGGTTNGNRRVSGLDAAGNFYFFSNFGAVSDFFYVVLEYETGKYRHFGAGELAGAHKNGDWTGGAFAYGAEWATGISDIDTPRSSQHSFLLDGLASVANEAATIHMEGFQNGPANSKWGVIGLMTLTPGNDTAGNGRYVVQGGARGGPHIEAFMPFVPAVNTGIVPGIPIKLYAINTTPAPDRAYLLGTMPDCRMISIGAFDPAAEITIGSETWKIFPAARKQYTAGGAGNTEESWNMGVIYRKA